MKRQARELERKNVLRTIKENKISQTPFKVRKEYKLKKGKKVFFYFARSSLIDKWF